MSTVRIVVLTVAMIPGAAAAGVHSIGLEDQLPQACSSRTPGEPAIGQSLKEKNGQNALFSTSAKFKLEPEQPDILARQATRYDRGVTVPASGITLQTTAQK